jgi:3',5'-cyclic AMP phosphodiesterase CpdA
MARAAIDAVLALDPAPDAVLVSGDLAYDGLPADYAALAAELGRLPMPVRVIPGNHDRRQPFRAALGAWIPAGPAGERVTYATLVGDVRVLALDSTIPDEPGGALGAEQLGWLDRELAREPRRPALVMLHHPPFACGIAHMDRIRCADGDALADVIARHPAVERVICGHVHRAIQMRFAGTIASICPGTAQQVTLDLRPEAPPSFHLEPPSFHLHAWIEGTGLVTHQAFIGRAPGPYPFAS